MASDKDLQGSNPYRDWLQNAVVIAPIGVGIGIGLRRMQTNSPVTVALPGASIVNKISRMAGDIVHTNIAASKSRRQKAGAELAKQLTSLNLADDIWKTVADQNALVQGMVDVFQDPSLGLSGEQSKQLGDRLVAAIGQLKDGAPPQEIQELIQKAGQTIGEMPEATQRFGERWQLWKGVKSQLAPSQGNRAYGSQFGRVVNSLKDITFADDEARNAAATNLGRIKELLGHDLEIIEGGTSGGGGVYVRHKSNRAIPIPIAAGSRKTAGGRSVATFQMGEGGQTIYTGSAKYARARQLETAFGKKAASAMSVKDLKDAQALVGFESIAIDIVERELRKTNRHGIGNPTMMNWKSVGESMRELLTVGFRGQRIMENSSLDIAKQYAAHRTASASLANAAVTVVGMGDLPRSGQERLIHNMAQANQAFETGISPGRLVHRTQSGQTIMTLGYAPLAAIRERRSFLESDKTGANYRANVAQITARFEQITGRDEMLMGGRKVGSYSANQAVDWSSEVTGSVNKLFLMDLNDTYKLKGEGQGLTSGTMTSVTGFTKPVIDPETGTSSKLMERILADTQEGKVQSYTMQELREAGGGGTFLGTDASGNMQHLRVGPSTQKLHIGTEMIEAHGKRQMHVTGVMESLIEDGSKLFSTLFKGTLIKVDDERMHQAASDLGFGRRFMNKYGVDPRDVVVVAGDMLKKSPENLNTQMITALGLISKSDNNIIAAISEAARTERYGLGTSVTARTAGAVLERMSSDINPRMAGMILAGAHRTNTSLRGGLEAAMQQRFSHRSANDIAIMMKWLQSGKTFGVAGATPGPQIGAYGVSQGSIEPRTVTMLMERLRGMGHGTEAISEVVGDLLSRKTGMEFQMGAAHAMATVLGGVQGHGVPQLGGRVLGIGELTEMAAKHGKGYVKKFLQENESFTLDFNPVSGMKGGNAIHAAAQTVFGPDARIPLVGGQALKNMRGAQIKTGRGNVAIGSEYEREVEHLLDDVLSLSTNQQQAESFAEQRLLQFKQNASELAVHSIFGVSRGKVQGTQFVQGSAYSMEPGSIQLTPHQQAFAQAAIDRTAGNAIFPNATAFLDQVHGEKGMGRGGLGGRLKQRRDMGQQLKQFFLGGEQGIEDARGVTKLLSRAPALGVGHVNPQQVYRHVAERFQGEKDPVWGMFTNSAIGSQAKKELEASLGTEIRGFHDIAKHHGVLRDTAQAGAQAGRNRAINNFFTKMAGSMDNWMASEGGGMLWYPKLRGQIKIKGKTEQRMIDLSVNAIMGGDSDGDTYELMAVGKNRGGKLMSSLTDSKARDAHVQMEMRLRATRQVYMDEADQSLKTIAKGVTGALDDSGRVTQDLIKEITAKDLGPASNALNKIRMAVASHGGDVEGSTRTLAMLDVMEESILKSKKAPISRDRVRRITGAVDELMSGSSASFEDLVYGEVFHGSELHGGGLEIESFTGGVGGKAAKSLEGFKINLRDDVELAKKAVAQMVTGGNVDKYLSAGSTLQSLEGVNSRAVFMNFAVSGESMQSAIMSGDQDAVKAAARALNGTAHTVAAAMGHMDKHILAPMVAGVAASMAIGTMLGIQSYKSDPMSMPGQMTSPDISQVVGEGRALGHNDPSVDPGMLGGGIGNTMIRQPINQGQIYMEKPNSYQIRGETSGYLGLSQATQYLGGMTRGSGSGSIMINDTRRPLTPNYIDRLTGEG